MVLQEWGAEVVGVDARESNLVHCPYTAVLADIAKDDIHALVTDAFDYIFCYGFLYHLEDPMAALENLARIDAPVMFVETMVCDLEREALLVEAEGNLPNQSITGTGCRPSPSWLAMALRAAGWEYVYTPTEKPDHPDFAWIPQDDGAMRRGGHRLRVVYVASKERMYRKKLETVDG
jgi:2-polyprenyl-3-methyl-5-hydroxy-6-metoxy-1,4-benzoquinol methylase